MKKKIVLMMGAMFLTLAFTVASFAAEKVMFLKVPEMY